MEYGMDSEMYTEQLNHVTDTLLRLYRPSYTYTLGFTSLQRLYKQLKSLLTNFYYCLVRCACLTASDIVVGYIWLAKLNV